MTDDHQTPAPQRRQKPTGRRTGDSGTRDAILDAALALFAERGYDGASVRAIASQAGVDPALIRHFFGDKDTLFATAVADRTTIHQQLGDSFNGAADVMGRRVADTYLRLWEDPATGPMLQALVRSSTSSPRAAEMLRGVLGARIPDLDSPTPDDHLQRLALAGSHLFGVAFARHVVKLPPLASVDHDTLVNLVAPAVQSYLFDPR